MESRSLYILVLLNISHWAADYTHLSTKKMLDAKRLGKPLEPILLHACVHYVLVAIILLFFLFPRSPFLWVALSVFELLTHFLIDIWKGRMNYWFPELQSPANKFHWYIFGFDQLLHQIVLILITYFTTNG